jgi:hypothetical protein
LLNPGTLLRIGKKAVNKGEELIAIMSLSRRLCRALDAGVGARI